MKITPEQLVPIMKKVTIYIKGQDEKFSKTESKDPKQALERM